MIRRPPRYTRQYTLFPYRRSSDLIHRYLGRKLDDSLPDFDGFVVRGFWKCGKREDICMDIVDNLRIIHKKTRRSGFFANRSA